MKITNALLISFIIMVFFLNIVSIMYDFQNNYRIITKKNDESSSNLCSELNNQEISSNNINAKEPLFYTDATQNFDYQKPLGSKIAVNPPSTANQIDYVDSMTDRHDPDNIGNYSDFTQMKILDNTYNTLTESNTSYNGPTSNYSASSYETSTWKTVGQIYASDSSYAIGTNGQTVNLYEFKIQSMEEKTIEGIEVFFEAYGTSGGTDDILGVMLLYNGRASSSLTVNQILTTTESNYVLGNSTYLWGRTWIATDFTQANFGINLLATTKNSAKKIYIDYLTIRVYYSIVSHELDREFSFNCGGVFDEDIQLSIKVGAISSETLQVDYWKDRSAIWTNVANISPSDSNGIKNISLVNLFFSTNMHFRFNDNITANDNVVDTWQIDAIFIQYKFYSRYFDYRKNITIDHTKIMRNLANFPVLVDIYDSDMPSRTQTTGNDILFALSNNIKLAHELELFQQNYNGTHSHLVAWVNVPSLSTSVDTTIFLFFGNTSITSQVNTKNVWTTKYTIVHHHEESPTSTITDSTYNGYNMSSIGSMVAGNNVKAKIGNGTAFDGTDDYYLSVNSITEVGSFAYSTWIKADSITTQYQYLITVGATSTNRSLLITNSGNLMFAYGESTYSFGVLTANTWYHLYFVYNATASTVTAYANGTQLGGVGSLTITSITDTFRFANRFAGLFDETHIYSTLPTFDWILTEYNNQKEPSSFYLLSKRQNMRDIENPTLINYGIDDPGTGSVKIWANVTDDFSGVSSVTLQINSSSYVMILNGNGYWIYDYSTAFNNYITYQIINATDGSGKYLLLAPIAKNHTFNIDHIYPSSDDPAYYSEIGDCGTFKVNVSDSWGQIHKAILNITDSLNTIILAEMNFNTGNQWIKDNIYMNNGNFYYKVIVNDTVGNSFTSNVRVDYFTKINSRPSVSNLILSPTPILSNQTLRLTYTFTDLDSDPNQSIVTWYKNDLIQSGLTGSTQITAGYLIRGDQWYASILPYDGKEYGSRMNSSVVTIRNTPPSLTTYSITPTNIYTDTNLAMAIIFTDDDGDSEAAGRTIEWYRNGTKVDILTDSSTVSNTYILKGEVWYFRIKVTDGTNYSTWYSSTTKTILNTAPTASALYITPSSPNTASSLTVHWNYSDIDNDSQSSSWSIQWFKNGFLQATLNNCTTIGEGNTTKEEAWYFTLKVYDGTDYSIVYTSSSTQIINTAPSATDYSVTPSGPKTNDDLTAYWLYGDIDNDNESTSWIIQWFKNGFLQAALNNSKIIGAGNTTKGENWHFTFQVFDGENYSIVYTATNATILNSVPTALGLTVSGTLRSDANLVAIWSFSDNDSDSQSSSWIIHWFNNSVEVSPLVNLNTVPHSYTKRGEIWSFSLQVYDGSNYSIVYFSGNFSINNAIPILTSAVKFNCTTALDDDNIAIEYHYEDVDGDTQNDSIIWWFRNGTYYPSMDDQTILLNSITTPGEYWYYIIRVCDGNEYSSNYTSIGIYIGSASNNPPNASGLTILPSSPTAETDLTGSYTYADPENQIESGTEIKWYKNGIMQPAYNNTLTIPKIALIKGDNWTFCVHPRDVIGDYGSWVNKTVTILNSLPIVSSLTITSNPGTTTNLMAGWTFADADTLDTEVSFQISWYCNGSLIIALNNLKSVPASYTTKNNRWNYTLKVFDGTNYSIQYNSGIVIILNSKPVANSVQIQSDGTIYTDENLNATWSFFDADTVDYGDSQHSYIIRWYKNGELQFNLNDQLTVLHTLTNKTQYWKFTIQVYDGSAWSEIVSSATITILNEVPIISDSVTITPASPKAGNDLTLHFTFIDLDGDTTSGTHIYWFKNGILFASDVFSISGMYIVKGDNWNVSVQPKDGVDFGLVYVSIEYNVQNTKPIVTYPYVNYVNELTTTTTITVGYTATDVDFDPLLSSNVNITWWRRVGTGPYNLVPALNNCTQVDSSYTTKGESWYFKIAVYDGSTWSDIVSSASEKVENTKPSIYNVLLSGGSNTDQSITLTYNFTDTDSDSESGSFIEWTVLRGGTPSYYHDTYTLDYIYIRAGDVIWCTIIPKDGEDQGATIITSQSNPVIIHGVIIVGDTAPVIDGIPSITTANGQYCASNSLNANYNASDRDGQEVPGSIYDISPTGTEYKWYKNNIWISAIKDSTVPTSYLVKGDKWYVQIRVQDKYGVYSDAVNSSLVIITNSAPIITGFTYNEEYSASNLYLTTIIDLNVALSYSDADNDPLVLNGTLIRWFKYNGSLYELLAARNSTYLSSSYYQRNDILFLLVIPNDGITNGLEYNSSYLGGVITIKNSIPSVTGITVKNTYISIDDISLLWNYSDADSDTEIISQTIIYWYQNGIYQKKFDGLRIINNIETEKGQIWWAIFRVYDGLNYSQNYTSNTINIVNSPTVLEWVFINNNATTATADILLNATIIYNDPDNDPILDYVIYWFINDVYHSEIDNRAQINGLHKGDKVYCVYGIYDGKQWSDFIESPAITIINKAPVVTNVVFTYEQHDINPNDINQHFIISDEILTISYTFVDVDGTDTDGSHIYWYKNGVRQSQYDNQKSLPANATLPGEMWSVEIIPYDGYSHGQVVYSLNITIESRQTIYNVGIDPLEDADGTYNIWVSTSDSKHVIDTIEVRVTIIELNRTELLVLTATNGTTNMWVWQQFSILNYLSNKSLFASLINSTIIVQITVNTKAIYAGTTYTISKIISFNFTITDNAPPRVLDAYFVWNDPYQPTSITFYALIEEYGEGVDEVTLLYSFVTVTDQETGVPLKLSQGSFTYKRLTMMPINATHYAATVSYTPIQSVDVYYNIEIKDKAGNINSNGFPDGEDPQLAKKYRFVYNITTGIPLEIFAILAIILLVISAVAIKKFSGKEIIGFDADIVMEETSKIPSTEIDANIDIYTMGIIIAFFDQRHGPIPIFVIPEILKDNFAKLVELSDRSFSATNFVSNFEEEIPTSFDFEFASGLKTSSLSFAYALNRPKARGGAENLTLNILTQRDNLTILQQFIEKFQYIIHDIHEVMDKNPDEKTKVAAKVVELRKLVTAIFLAHQSLYGDDESDQDT